MADSSANEIQPRAQMALAGSPICELRELRVEPEARGLVISGVVSSFYHKQLAQEAVWEICRSIEVELINAIRVQNDL